MGLEFSRAAKSETRDAKETLPRELRHEAEQMMPQIRQLMERRDAALEIIESAGIKLQEPYFQRMWLDLDRAPKKDVTILEPQSNERHGVAIASVLGKDALSPVEIANLEKYSRWLHSRVGVRGNGPNGDFTGVDLRVSEVLKDRFDIAAHDSLRAENARKALSGVYLTESHALHRFIAGQLVRGGKSMYAGFKPDATDNREIREILSRTSGEHAPLAKVFQMRKSYFFVHPDASPTDIEKALDEAIARKARAELHKAIEDHGEAPISLQKD